MAAPKRSYSWLLWLIILAGLGAGGWYGWRRYQQKTASGTADYRTNVVSRGNLIQSVTANGSLTPVRLVEVGSQVSGILTEVRVDFNSEVKLGEVLAKIDPATYERALARADADLLNSNAALGLAQFNSKRAKELFTGKLISETEAEQTDVALHQAEAQVKIREAAVETAKVDLERTTILAPIDGVVITKSVEAGQTVAASFSTPRLFTIANDLRQMQIEAAVSEADIGNVETGQKVNFSVDAFMSRQFQGKVKQVRFAPSTNQNVVSYTTVVEVNNADLKLRPGMTANASIIINERTNVLLLPAAALRFSPPKDALLIKPTTAEKPGPSTNAPEAAVQLATSGPFAGLPIPPWTAERRRPTQEERDKYAASLTPEQKVKYQQARDRMRQMMAEGGGGGGGGGGGFGGGGAGTSRPMSEGPTTRTIYVLTAAGDSASPNSPADSRPTLEARTVRLGISDGSNTEILSGLKEGDVIVTGLNTPVDTSAAAGGPPRAPSSNPFGGGGRRF